MTDKERFDKFFGKEWADLLLPFLSSKDYEHIGEYLKYLKANKVKVTPHFNKIFRAFKECPFYTTHTIIIGQDVYPSVTKDGDLVADGLAFSSNTSEDPPVSLQSILDAISESVYDGSDSWCPTAVWNHEEQKAAWDLKLWAKQGMLLLNCALTTELGKPGAHMEVWRSFIQYVINVVTNRKDSLGVVLIGAEARKLKQFITNPTTFILECEHPAAASYHRRPWYHQRVFSRLTAFQKEANNIEIKW